MGGFGGGLGEFWEVLGGGLPKTGVVLEEFLEGFGGGFGGGPKFGGLGVNLGGPGWEFWEFSGGNSGGGRL